MHVGSGKFQDKRRETELQCTLNVHKVNTNKLRNFYVCTVPKNTKPQYLTSFLTIFIPNKMHISNKHSKSGAQIIAKRQGSLVAKIELRTSWSIYGIDIANKQHKISLRTMISWITWEDDQGKMHQLYHSVDSRWNDKGNIFGWHPQFDDQAQIFMTGSLPYLKSFYGNTVKLYFSPGAVSMQSKQRWDKEKGGVIGEDEKSISSMTGVDSWWDKTEGNAVGTPSQRNVAIGATKKTSIDAKNVVTIDIPDVNDNETLPLPHIKAGEGDEDNTTMNDIITAPPPMIRTLVNDKSTISSNITMDTQMDSVENNMVTINHNIRNLENSVNHMSHMLAKFMREMKQSNNLPPAEDANKHQDSTKVAEDTNLGNPQKWVHSPGVSQEMLGTLTLKGLRLRKCQEAVDQWGDLAAGHRALRVGFMNI